VTDRARRAGDLDLSLIYSLTTSFLSNCLIPPIAPRVVWFGNYK
jgi:hypothetical protein